MFKEWEHHKIENILHLPRPVAFKLDAHGHACACASHALDEGARRLDGAPSSISRARNRRPNRLAARRTDLI